MSAPRPQLQRPASVVRGQLSTRRRDRSRWVNRAGRRGQVGNRRRDRLIHDLIDLSMTGWAALSSAWSGPDRLVAAIHRRPSHLVGGPVDVRAGPIRVGVRSWDPLNGSACPRSSHSRGLTFGLTRVPAPGVLRFQLVLKDTVHRRELHRDIVASTPASANIAPIGRWSPSDCSRQVMPIGSIDDCLNVQFERSTGGPCHRRRTRRAGARRRPQQSRCRGTTRRTGR